MRLLKERLKKLRKTLFGSKKRKIITIVTLIAILPVSFAFADTVQTYQWNQTNQAIRGNAEKAAKMNPIAKIMYDVGKPLHLHPEKSKFVQKGYIEPQKARDRFDFAMDKKSDRDQALSRIRQSSSKKSDEYNQLLKKLKKKGIKPGTPKYEKAVEKFVSSNDKDYAKKAAKDVKDQNKQDEKDLANAKKDEEDSFGGKIAKALLHAFWSTGVGKWVVQNGAAGTIFTYNPFDEKGNVDLSKADVAGQLEDKINNHPSQLMFPSSAYGTRLTTVMDELYAPMVTAAAFILVVAIIVINMRVGVGQALGIANSRQEWLKQLFDVFISTVGIFWFFLFVRLLLQVDGAFLQLFATFMQNVKDANGNSLMATALTLGMDDNAIKALTEGTFLGSGFAGVIFIIIYLFTAIALAVVIKYFYFMRMVAFIILVVLAPIFIALWPFTWGKSRTINWVRDMVGVVLIQPIHAFTITLMATLMVANSSKFGGYLLPGDKKDREKEAKEIINQANNTNNTDTLRQTSDMINGVDYTSNFETMVVGFIVLILFQPVSKEVARLFGIEFGLLEGIHKATSRTLATTALVAGGAAVGVASGLAAGTVGAAQGGLALGQKAMAKNMAKQAVKQEAKGAGAFTLQHMRNRAAKLAEASDKNKVAAKAWMSQASGLVGRNAAKVMGAAAGAGTGNVANIVALSAAGGEISERAAKLNKTGMSLAKLGLKKVDAYRQQKANQKEANAVTGATDQTLMNAAQKKIDSNPGPQGEILERIKNDARLTKEEQNNALESAKQYQDTVEGLAANDAVTAQRVQSEMLKDKNGKYVGNDKVQKENENIIPDGKAYDANYGAPKDLQAAKNKANALGFDLDKYRKSWGQAPTSVAKKPEDFIADANVAMNNMKGQLTSATQQAAGAAGAATTDYRVLASPSEIEKAVEQAEANYENKVASQFSNPSDLAAYKATRKYANGLNQVREQARQHAFATSNGATLAHFDQSDNAAFNNSIIDAQRYKEDLASQLDGTYVNDSLRNQLLSVPDGMDGQSMIQQVSFGNEVAQVINQGLYDRMNNQRAFSLRSHDMTLNGKEITGNDLGDIVSPGVLANQLPGEFGTVQQYQNYINEKRKKNYTDYQRAYNDFASSAGSLMGANMIGGMLEKGLGFNPSSFRPSQQTQELMHSRSALTNALEKNPYENNWGSFGITLDEARQMVPTRYDANGESIGTAPGALRMRISNNLSELQARDEKGNYHTIGNYGPGESSLGPSDYAYQDLDFSSDDGSLMLRKRPNSHEITAPYRISKEGKVPVTLPNGVPDLGSYFSNSPQQDNQISRRNSPYAYSEFQGIPNSSQLIHAFTNGNNVFGDSYQGWYDLALRGDSNGVVMTGVDPTDGQIKAMSQLSKNTIWPNMESDFTFSIPIENSEGLGEFTVDDTRRSVLSAKNGARIDQARMQSARAEMEDLFAGHRTDILRTLNESVLMPTKPDQRNFIANHGGHYSFNSIDTFSKI